MNKENERKQIVEEVTIVDQKVTKISEAEVRSPDSYGGVKVSWRGGSRVFDKDIQEVLRE